MRRTYAAAPATFKDLTKATICAACRHGHNVGRRSERRLECHKTRLVVGDHRGAINPGSPACRFFRWKS